jgi:hypothetical protein
MLELNKQSLKLLFNGNNFWIEQTRPISKFRLEKFWGFTVPKKLSGPNFDENQRFFRSPIGRLSEVMIPNSKYCPVRGFFGERF